MTRVSIENGYIIAGDRRVPFLQGEFHFWRNTRCFWPRILGSLKDIGFTHLATYVEWAFHRVTPDGTPLDEVAFDFTGETDQQRDLEGYLATIDADDTLWLTVRPGPYIYAETEFGGPPGEVASLHRLHPTFLAHATRYLEAACKVLAPHQATRGGKIVLCQLDNEVSMIKAKGQIIGGRVDQHGSYACFLHEKYGDLDTVNRTYGTRWEDWEDAEPTMAPSGKKEFVAFLDAAEYIEWYCAEYFKIIAKIYRDNGIDVPFYVNSTGGPFPHDPARLGDITCMTDLYYMGALRTMLPYNARFLRPWQPITASAEFRCGTFGPAMPDNLYVQQAAMWMAHGFHGVNYFMMVDRHRWANCPVDAVGRPGTPQLYKIFKTICHAYNELDYPRFANGLVCDVNMLWWRKHAYTIKPDPTEPYNNGEQLDADTTFNHAFRTFLDGNMQFEFLVPGAPRNKEKPVIVYSAHDYCDASFARDLLRHAEAGGTVVFYHNHPVKTPAGDQLDVFDGHLVPPRAVHRHSGPAIVQQGLEDRDAFGTGFSTTTTCFADYDVSSLGIDGIVPYRHLHATAGYAVPAGKGRLVVAGFDLDPQSVHPFMATLGITSPVKTAARDVSCTLLRHGNEHVAGVVNLSPEPRIIDLAIDPAKLDLSSVSSVRSMLQASAPVVAGNTVRCKVPGGEGDILWLA